MIMAQVTLTLDEYEALRALIGSERESEGEQASSAPKPKRKASAYSKRYGRAFKQVQHKYKLKSGSWAKDGFKRAQNAAHAMAKKK
tara:strand:+ start:492 stop:749 length:258 start_codon:yes stop_codon:yes gene_type:complete